MAAEQNRNPNIIEHELPRGTEAERTLDTGDNAVQSTLEKTEQDLVSTESKLSSDALDMFYKELSATLKTDLKREEVVAKLSSAKDYEEFAKAMNITDAEAKRHMESYFNWTRLIAGKVATAKQELTTIRTEYTQERAALTLEQELTRVQRGETNANASLGEAVDVYMDRNPYLREYKGEFQSILDNIRMSLAVIAKNQKGGLPMVQGYYREVLTETMREFSKNNPDKKAEAEAMKKKLQTSSLRFAHQAAPFLGLSPAQKTSISKPVDFKATLEEMKGILTGTIKSDKTILELYNKISEGAPGFISEIVESEHDSRLNQQVEYQTSVNNSYKEFLDDVQLLNSPEFIKHVQDIMLASSRNTGDGVALMNNISKVAAELGINGVEDLPANMRAMVRPEKFGLTPDTDGRNLAIAIAFASLAVVATGVSVGIATGVLWKGIAVPLVLAAGTTASLALGDLPIMSMETLARIDASEIKLLLDLKKLGEQANEETDPVKKKALTDKMQNIVDVIAHKRSADLEKFVRNEKDLRKGDFMDELGQSLTLDHEKRGALIEKFKKEQAEVATRNPQAVETYTRYQEVLLRLQSKRTPEEEKAALNKEALTLENKLIDMGLSAFVSTAVKAQMSARSIEYNTDQYVDAMLNNLSHLDPNEANRLKEYVNKANNTEQTLQYLGTLSLKYAEIALAKLNRLDPEAKLVFDETMKTATAKDQIAYASSLMDRLKPVLENVPENEASIAEFFQSMDQEITKTNDQKYKNILARIERDDFDSEAARVEFKQFVRQNLGDKYLSAQGWRSVPLVGLFVWGTYDREWAADQTYQNKLDRMDLLTQDDLKSIIYEVYALDKNKLTEEMSRTLATSSEKRRQELELSLLTQNFETFKDYASRTEKQAEGEARLRNTEIKHLSNEQLVFAEEITAVRGMIEALQKNINAAFDDRMPIGLEAETLDVYYMARSFMEKYDPKKQMSATAEQLKTEMAADKARLMTAIKEAEALVDIAAKLKTRADRDAFDNYSLFKHILKDKAEGEFTSGERSKEAVKKYVDAKNAYLGLMQQVNLEAGRIQGVDTATLQNLVNTPYTNTLAGRLHNLNFYSPNMFRSLADASTAEYQYGDRTDQALTKESQNYATMTKEAQLFLALLKKVPSGAQSRTGVRTAMESLGVKYRDNYHSGPGRGAMNVPIVESKDIPAGLAATLGAAGVGNDRVAGMINSIGLMIKDTARDKNPNLKERNDDYLDVVREVMEQIKSLRSRYKGSEMPKDPEFAQLMLLSKLDLSALLMNMKPVDKKEQQYRMINLAQPYQGGKFYANMYSGQDVLKGSVPLEIEGEVLMLDVFMRRGCANVQIPQQEMLRFVTKVMRKLPLKETALYQKVLMQPIPGVDLIQNGADKIDRSALASDLFMLGKENIGVIPAQTWTWISILISILIIIVPGDIPNDGPKGGGGETIDRIPPTQTPPTQTPPTQTPPTQTPPTQTPPTSTLNDGPKGGLNTSGPTRL